MADDAASEPLSSTEATETPDSLLADLRDLAEDTRTAVEAELAFQQARAGYVAGAAQGIAVRFALAALLAIIALCTLAVGVLLGLTPLIGPWGATAIVVAALLILALAAALTGRSALRRLMRNAFPATDTPT
jgi:hypothetical protein